MGEARAGRMTMLSRFEGCVIAGTELGANRIAGVGGSVRRRADRSRSTLPNFHREIVGQRHPVGCGRASGMLGLQRGRKILADSDTVDSAEWLQVVQRLLGDEAR